MKRKYNYLKNALKLIVVALCLTGFLIQTWMFLLFYWSYPTVVDIQKSIPLEIDMPAVTFCNSNGIKPRDVCLYNGLCFQPYILKFLPICESFPEMCTYGSKSPTDFSIVAYQKYIRDYDFNTTAMNRIKKPLESFVKCKIIRGNQELECAMEDIITGSYYSDSNMFNFCYTLNTVWGKPGKKIEKIGKYDKIVFEFFVDLSDRPTSEDIYQIRHPLFNYPSNAAIQIVVHNPLISSSPFSSGIGLLGGKNYRIKLKEERKHLLPPPYQTNCTDYMPAYLKSGNSAPINQIMVLEECKYKMALELKGCVPFSIDYPPENITICKYCKECTDISEISDKCMEILDNFNQPCDYNYYTMRIEEMYNQEKKLLENLKTGENETFVFTSKGYNCKISNMFTQICQRLKVEIVFDDYEISNITYKPKIENLELFSVIGGYMGLYLGVSAVAMYDLVEWSLVRLNGLFKKKRRKMRKNRIRKSKVFPFTENEEIPKKGFRRRNKISSFR